MEINPASADLPLNGMRATSILAGTQVMNDDGTLRTFATGATRDTTTGKLDLHRFLSPKALRCYCQYMDKHRVQSDGTLRDPDNWKKGFGNTIEEKRAVFMASLTRHFWEAWESFEERGEIDLEVLSALFFNVHGLMHEELHK